MNELTETMRNVLADTKMDVVEKKKLCKKVVNTPNCNLETFKLCLEYLQFGII